MRVHLIDGTYELFRSFYGAPPATGRDGQEVGATRGLLRSLAALAREPEVTHIAVAFDTVIESFRNELFAGYKTGAGIDPKLLGQFELAERAAAALGFVVWGMIDFEADDALATAAARGAADPAIEQVVICSPDKDFGQCVRGDKVVMWDRRRNIVLDEAAVIAKVGVGPESIPDYLALVGDSADGIPGIPRWGSRSTATLLSRYRTIENIPAHAASWDVSVRGAAALADALAAQRDDALLYKKLATLRTDVPLAESIDDLRWRGPNLDALAAICDHIGERDVIDRLRAGA